MDKPRPCGCKGRRTCLSCEADYGLNHNDTDDIQDHPFESKSKLCTAPLPSRRQSYNDKRAEDRISYCTAPLDTRGDFDFSDCQFSLSDVDVQSDETCVRSSSAPLRSTPRVLSSSLNQSKDIDNCPRRSFKSDVLFPNTKLSHKIDLQSELKCERNIHLNQTQPSRYHVRQLSKPDCTSGRHRKTSNKDCFEVGKDSEDESKGEMNFNPKMHRIHRPKTALQIQTAPISHPRRGVGRVGVQVSINDCVCIASSADLGTATESKTELGNKRHVLTWASRIPAEPGMSHPLTQQQESDSGTQIDILSATPHPQETPQNSSCNCMCQPQPPQTAAGYYHSMQSRQTYSAELEENGNQSPPNAFKSESKGGRSSLTENQQGISSFQEGRPGVNNFTSTDRTRPGVNNFTSKDRTRPVGILPGRYRKKRRGSLRDWNDPHKLYPDPLRWGGDHPFRWEDNLRNTETNALIAVHPQRWMPVGKQQYSHHHGYPSWPDAITNMLIPWSEPAYCCDLPQPRQTMTCWPDTQCGPPMTCSVYPRSCGNNRRDRSYVFCPWCQKAWPGWDMNLYRLHPNHDGEPLDYPGIFIEMDWLTEEEEKKLVTGMDEMPWDISQSGRRKQNFGPKCNFKKRKMKLGDFNGFPAFSKFVQDKFSEVPILEGYFTIEQCSLEYDPSKGASIDRHIDDCWVWGERIVTVNLLSDSVLTMTPYSGEEWRYNLPLVSTYEPVLSKSGTVVSKQIKLLSRGDTTFEDCIDSQNNTEISQDIMKDIVVRIPMPRRSLLVIFGSPRYDWEHRVLREDVSERRLCLAYREFTPPYLPGGKQYNESEAILNAGSMFWDHVKCTGKEQIVS